MEEDEAGDAARLSSPKGPGECDDGRFDEVERPRATRTAPTAAETWTTRTSAATGGLDDVRREPGRRAAGVDDRPGEEAQQRNRAEQP